MQRRYTPRVAAVCQACGKQMMLQPSQMTKGRGKFCSKSCANIGAPEDIWKKVTKDSNGCWLWGGAITKYGYGHVGYKHKIWRAHRLAYELVNGPISPGKVVCHSCDVKRCINPDHLWVGTQADNVHDYLEKQRLKHELD